MWAILSFILIAIIFIPNVFIAIKFFSQPNENWRHIQEYLLIDYIVNSVVIIACTAVMTTIIGTSLAWLVTIYQFPLRNFFRWGLILPLAIPPYIGAYTYHGILNYTGIIQKTLRNTFDIHVNPAYFDMMTIEGAIIVFTLFLYPYVYTITVSFLESQSASVIENARLLRGNNWSIFFHIVLPISRAAIVGGVVLVILEVLNDFGVASYFGIQTFSTAIFRTWHGLKDLDSALKLAGALMMIVIMVLVLEKLIRGRRRYSDTLSQAKPIDPEPVHGVKGWIVFAFCFIIFSFAFIIPVLQLIHWAFLTYDKVADVQLFRLIYQSVFVATVAASLIVVVALIIANYTRLHKGMMTKIASRVTTLGYSIPGAAIAIAVITLFIMLDQSIERWLAFFSMQPGFVLRTSLVMLIFAYIIRFLAVGYNAIEAGFEKVGTSYTEASRALGMGTVQSFFRVDIPMVRGAIISGFILVFVDILKELPLTLFLQPFNFATLATQAYKYANDEMVHEAALSSLIIVLVSAICIYAFHRGTSRRT